MVHRPLRVLLTGGQGQLGLDLRDVLAGVVPAGGADRGTGSNSAGLPAASDVLPPVDAGTFEVLATDIDDLDLRDREAVAGAVSTFRPDLVLHGGAFTAVDACESDPDTAFAVNALGTRHVAEAASSAGAHLVYVSTDYVFDGTLDRPYREWDEPGPRSVYGASKLAGEREVTAIAGPAATIVRTAWVAGVHGANIPKTVLRLARSDPAATLTFVDDQHGCPTFTADLARAIVRLGMDRRPGVFHVTNTGETTWFDLARATLVAAGMDPERVRPIATADLDPPRPAPRPANSRLDDAAWRLSGLPEMPAWQGALERMVAALPADG